MNYYTVIGESVIKEGGVIKERLAVEEIDVGTVFLIFCHSLGRSGRD
jgi:hypothetical protein